MSKEMQKYGEGPDNVEDLIQVCDYFLEHFKMVKNHDSGVLRASTDHNDDDIPDNNSDEMDV